MYIISHLFVILYGTSLLLGTKDCQHTGVRILYPQVLPVLVRTIYMWVPLVGTAVLGANLYVLTITEVCLIFIDCPTTKESPALRRDNLASLSIFRGCLTKALCLLVLAQLLLFYDSP